MIWVGLRRREPRTPFRLMRLPAARSGAADRGQAVYRPAPGIPIATGSQGLMSEDVTYLVRDAVWIAIQGRLKIASLGRG
jgi:hypothetical protein